MSEAFGGEWGPEFRQTQTPGQDRTTGYQPLGKVPWRLTVNGLDRSCNTAFDFRVTWGRQDSESQPDPTSAKFTFHAIPESQRWATPGAAIVLSVQIQQVWITVATLTVSDVTRIFHPAAGTYSVEVTCVGALAVLARRTVAGPDSTNQQWLLPQYDADRVALVCEEAGMLTVTGRYGNRQLWNDVDGSRWTSVNISPAAWTRALPLTWNGEDIHHHQVDVEVDVAVDAPARILLWIAGVTAYYFEVPHAGIWRVQGIRPVGLGAPEQVAVIVDGIPSPIRWMDVDPAITWSTYDTTQTWGTTKTTVASHIVRSRAWVTDWQPKSDTLLNPVDVTKGPYSALKLAQEAAKSARGVLFETPGGSLVYQSRATRRSLTKPLPTRRRIGAEFSRAFNAAFTRTQIVGATYQYLDIDACLIEGQTKFTSTIGQIINRASVAYGGDGQDRPVVTAEHAGSIGSFGVLAVAITDLPLFDAPSALAMANELVQSRYVPIDILAGLQTLDSNHLPDLLVRDIFTAPPGSIISIVGAADGWHGGTRYDGYLDGWELTGRAGFAVSFGLWLSPLLPSARSLPASQPAQQALDVSIVDHAHPIPVGISPPKPIVIDAPNAPAGGGRYLWRDSTTGIVSAWVNNRWEPVK